MKKSKSVKMNLVLGCSLSSLVVRPILLHILLLVSWSNCSYFDAIYRSVLPKQWSSSSSSSSFSFPTTAGRSSQNRYLSLRSRPINFGNPRQSNKFNGNKLFAPNDDSHHLRLLFGTERQSSSILDQQSLQLEQPYDQASVKQPQGNPPIGQPPANQPAGQAATGCNCNPIIKTKYIAIEIPKVVRVPGETNSQSPPPPSTEAVQPAPTTSPSTYASDAGSASKETANDGAVSGKTRIITIREIPNSVSKTLLVNSYEGHMYETSSRSSVSSAISAERERETEKVEPQYQSNTREPAARPNRVQQLGKPTLSTYVGFEDY